MVVFHRSTSISLTSVGYFYDIFPICMVWVSSLFLLTDGGRFVSAAVVTAVVAGLVQGSCR